MTKCAWRWIAFLVVVALGMGAAPTSADDELHGRATAAAPNADAPSGWDLALTGGFVTTGLADPVWALGTLTGQASRVVLRQPDQESTVNLGVAVFAQVYHDRHPWIAPLSCGIGLRGDSRATFYLGSALRFGSHASLTGGVAVGPIAALPAGVAEGKTVTDTNLLSDLGTRTTGSWFIGVTYTFATVR
jgi:hypothetical protein